MIESGSVKTALLTTIVFAATFGIIAASQPDRSASGYHHQEWVQPPEVARQTPVPISSHEWAFNYRPVEGLVNALASGASDGLALNSHALERLERIASGLPQTLSETAIERIGFLSQQGVPAPIANDLADTLKGFLRYRQAMREPALAIDSGNPAETARTRFERSVVLQNRYLGDSRAEQLFGQQRRLQRYLIERQAIHANPDLSAAARQKALDRVSERFESGSGLESVQ
jgi:hypothetical protein